MDQGMSWTGEPPLFPPTDAGRKARWIDSRTCVLPVKLEKGSYYRVGINSTSHRNFRNKDKVPVAPSVICFTTDGATEEVASRVRIPTIVSFDPKNNAIDVDPKVSELRVTFDMPMGDGMSWMGGSPRLSAIVARGRNGPLVGRRADLHASSFARSRAKTINLVSTVRARSNFQSASGACRWNLSSTSFAHAATHLELPKATRMAWLTGAGDCDVDRPSQFDSHFWRPTFEFSDRRRPVRNDTREDLGRQEGRKPGDSVRGACLKSVRHEHGLQTTSASRTRTHNGFHAFQPDRLSPTVRFLASCGFLPS